MLDNCQKEQEYVDPGNRDQFFDAQMSCIQAEFFDGNMQGAISRVNRALSSVQARQSNGWQLTFQLLLVNANRQIINSNAGQINYDTGVITLNDLKVLSVSATDGLLRFTAVSENGVIESSRNTIITIDETDTSAIVTTISKLSS